MDRSARAKFLQSPDYQYESNTSLHRNKWQNAVSEGLFFRMIVTICQKTIDNYSKNKALNQVSE